MSYTDAVNLVTTIDPSIDHHDVLRGGASHQEIGREAANHNYQRNELAVAGISQDGLNAFDQVNRQNVVNNGNAQLAANQQQAINNIMGHGQNVGANCLDITAGDSIVKLARYMNIAPGRQLTAIERQHYLQMITNALDQFFTHEVRNQHGVSQIVQRLNAQPFDFNSEDPYRRPTTALINGVANNASMGDVALIQYQRLRMELTLRRVFDTAYNRHSAIRANNNVPAGHYDSYCGSQKTFGGAAGNWYNGAINPNAVRIENAYAIIWDANNFTNSHTWQNGGANAAWANTAVEKFERNKGYAGLLYDVQRRYNQGADADNNGNPQNANYGTLGDYESCPHGTGNTIVSYHHDAFGVNLNGGGVQQLVHVVQDVKTSAQGFVANRWRNDYNTNTPLPNRRIVDDLLMTYMNGLPNLNGANSQQNGRNYFNNFDVRVRGQQGAFNAAQANAWGQFIDGIRNGLNNNFSSLNNDPLLQPGEVTDILVNVYALDLNIPL